MADAPSPAKLPPLPKPLSLEEFKRMRKPFRPAVKVRGDHLSSLDKLACFITDHVGTMGFFLIIFGWTVTWLALNFFLPKNLRFDPPMAFVFYLFISNVIQILLMPLIMVGQNVQGRASDKRAENDLEVNIKAEKEIEVILEHLEYQNKLLLDLLGKVDQTVAEAIKRREADMADVHSAIRDLAAKTSAAGPSKPRVASKKK